MLNTIQKIAPLLVILIKIQFFFCITPYVLRFKRSFDVSTQTKGLNLKLKQWRDRQQEASQPKMKKLVLTFDLLVDPSLDLQQRETPENAMKKVFTTWLSKRALDNFSITQTAIS